MTLHERWDTEPFVPFHDYADIYGNVCRRLTLPAGRFTLRYDAIVEASAELDPYEPNAIEHDPGDLPDEALVYTLPSRFCLSDVVFPRAMELFGNVKPGWSRVQAICDFVHNHIAFGYGSSGPMTTAIDVLDSGAGVCRDYAHLAITFCRALNIPARYSFGYMPDIDIPPPYSPMDFCAWFEVYLGGRWWIFDARNNVPRRARITIARGRDALDVAMLTTYSATMLEEMVVRADPAEANVRSLV
jgi:transglutaminase-like putative cysteine protease